jgi:phosphatidylserine/phosphatidylglycerophosphate/cardiolipin synthase-like enzyme
MTNAKTSPPSRILTPGHNSWRELTAEDNGLVVDACDYYYEFYRAARAAKHSILMAGWQFDSGVQLLRGPDVAKAGAQGKEVRLLKFLDGLCEQRPDLHVYILAWDFHMVFALEREWMQKLWFDWTTNERLHFHFDDSCLPGGCHHQKFVVIDGRLSFLGGIDICESRWDDRRHRARNPLRISRGRAQKPYHDLQAYFSGGEVAGALTELFRERWRMSGADPMSLPEPPPPGGSRAYVPRGALRFPRGAKVAISRTEPRRSHSVREIRALYVDAVARAERMIYIETQYFSSRTVCQALTRRMRDGSRPKLEIVLVLNPKAEAVKEEIAVGLRQAEVVAHLRQVAAETGHALGVYYTVADAGGQRKPPARAFRRSTEREVRGTYIHSKMMVVDDRFLTIGSANLTNRSMGIDSELNACWETPRASSAVGNAIRQVRVSLLAEHTGLTRPATLARLTRPAGLVAFLDALVENDRGRLRAHPVPTAAEAKVLEVIDPQALPFDPELPEEDEAAESPEAQRTLFKGGLSALWDKLAGDEPTPRPRTRSTAART